jgi:hypothetical protein
MGVVTLLAVSVLSNLVDRAPARLETDEQNCYQREDIPGSEVVHRGGALEMLNPQMAG